MSSSVQAAGQTTVAFQTSFSTTTAPATRVFNLEITSDAQAYYIAQMSIIQHALLDDVECDSNGNVSSPPVYFSSSTDAANAINAALQSLDKWSQMISVDASGNQVTNAADLPSALSTSSTMTRYMASDLDTLERTLAAAGITPLSSTNDITAECTAIGVIRSDDVSTQPVYNVRSLIASALKDASNALIVGQGNTQSTSIQQLLMVDYIATGNEVLYNQMTNLQNAINLNQNVLSYLNSLQDLMNQKTASQFLMQLTSLNSSSPDYSAFEKATFGDQVIGTTADFTEDELQKYLALLTAQANGADLTTEIAKIEYGFGSPSTDAQRIKLFQELVSGNYLTTSSTSIPDNVITGYTPTAYDQSLWTNYCAAVNASPTVDITQLSVQLQYDLTDLDTAINTLLTQNPSLTEDDLFNDSDASNTILQRVGLMPNGHASYTYIASVLKAIYDGAQSAIAENPGLDPRTATAMAESAVAANPPIVYDDEGHSIMSWSYFLNPIGAYPTVLNNLVSTFKSTFSWVSQIENGFAQPSTDAEKIAFFQELISDGRLDTHKATSLPTNITNYTPTTYDNTLWTNYRTAVNAGADITDPAVQLQYGLTDFDTAINTILSQNPGMTAAELFDYTNSGSVTLLTNMGLLGTSSIINSHAECSGGTASDQYADKVYEGIYNQAQAIIAANPDADPRVASYMAMVYVGEDPPAQITTTVTGVAHGTGTCVANWALFVNKEFKAYNVTSGFGSDLPAGLASVVNAINAVPATTDPTTHVITSSPVGTATDSATVSAAQTTLSTANLVATLTAISDSDQQTALIAAGLCDPASTTSYGSLLGANSVEVLINLQKAGLLDASSVVSTGGSGKNETYSFTATAATTVATYGLTAADATNFGRILAAQAAGFDPTESSVQTEYGITITNETLGANIAAGTSPDAFVNVISGQYNGSGGIQAIITNLQSLISLAKSQIGGSSATSLVSELTTILGDFQSIQSSGGGIATWVTNFTNNAEGTYQTNLNNGVVASQSLNDTQRENLQQVMFVYQQFYQSATSMLSALMTLMQSIASNISSS